MDSPLPSPFSGLNVPDEPVTLNRVACDWLLPDAASFISSSSFFSFLLVISQRHSYNSTTSTLPSHILLTMPKKDEFSDGMYLLPCPTPGPSARLRDRRPGLTACNRAVHLRGCCTKLRAFATRTLKCLMKTQAYVL